MMVESCRASFTEPHYPNGAFCGFTREPETEELLEGSSKPCRTDKFVEDVYLYQYYKSS